MITRKPNFSNLPFFIIFYFFAQGHLIRTKTTKHVKYFTFLSHVAKRIPYTDKNDKLCKIFCYVVKRTSYLLNFNVTQIISDLGKNIDLNREKNITCPKYFGFINFQKMSENYENHENQI